MAIARDASSPVRFTISNSGGTASGTSASFTPPANSLLRVSATINAAAGASPSFNNPTYSGSGVGAFSLVKSQVNALGGAVAIWQAQVGASPTAGTVGISVTSTGSTTTGAESAGWVDVWTGADSSQTGAATAGNTSTTQNFSPTITTTRTGSQVHGVGIDWNARGNPTSTDTIDSYTVAGQTSGGRAFKAANSGAPGSVAVNFNAAAASPQWATALAEILAPVAAGTAAPRLMLLGVGA